MQIMIDLYSGRENPFWNLSEEQKSILLNELQPLSACEKIEEKAILGYRGFIVEEEDDITFPEVVVFNGHVIFKYDKGFEYYADPGRKIEHDLLKTSAGNISDDVYEFLEKTITKKTYACTSNICP